jgi:hypothetical protein
MLVSFCRWRRYRHAVIPFVFSPSSVCSLSSSSLFVMFSISLCVPLCPQNHNNVCLRVLSLFKGVLRPSEARTHATSLAASRPCRELAGCHVSSRRRAAQPRRTKESVKLCRAGLFGRRSFVCPVDADRSLLSCHCLFPVASPWCVVIIPVQLVCYAHQCFVCPVDASR